MSYTIEWNEIMNMQKKSYGRSQAHDRFRRHSRNVDFVAFVVGREEL